MSLQEAIAVFTYMQHNRLIQGWNQEIYKAAWKIICENAEEIMGREAKNNG